MSALPTIVQGGMGVAVSDWRLARAVSVLGQLGTVSGTGLDTVLVRRLQDGDAGGHVRRAMAQFPFQDVASAVVRRFFRPEGRAPAQPYARLPLATARGSRAARGTLALGAFTEVFLAKEGHEHPVGINLLTKLQLPTLATLYGAMLAGVDWVMMGAGIPTAVPAALDAFARQEPFALQLHVANTSDHAAARSLVFDPAELGELPGPLARPAFAPIVSSHALAAMLVKRASGTIQGFVVESPTAGGHNAPPRGRAPLDASGQPQYGPRDEVDLAEVRALGLPFWLAGGAASPGGLRDAVQAGAAGIQVGTMFAYAEESGLAPSLKQAVLERARAGDVRVRTDPRASPTGFPFKVVEAPGTLSDARVYADRERVCDLGYLREVYERPDGGLGYRCAAEPVEAYVAKGGKREDTVGRKCLCNALMSDVGLAQIQKNGDVERPLITSGDDLRGMTERFPAARRPYSAAEVVSYLLGG